MPMSLIRGYGIKAVPLSSKQMIRIRFPLPSLGVIMKKSKEIMDSTDNSAYYKKARKAYLAQKGVINCTFCPYHAKENMERVPQKNWKKFRKHRWKE